MFSWSSVRLDPRSITANQKIWAIKVYPMYGDTTASSRK